MRSAVRSLGRLSLLLVLWDVRSVALAGPQSSLSLVLPVLPTRSITVVGGAVDLPRIGLSDTTGKTATGTAIFYSSPGTNDSITVAIDTAVPSGAFLSVLAAQPSCTAPCTPGSAAGELTLSSSAQTLINQIGEVSDGEAALTYRITTDGAAEGIVTRTVTFTISAA